MGEIKSTLDIVMEKTKHLSLSEAEKDAQKIEEIRKTVRGMIQKFKDQILPKDRFREQLGAIENSDDRTNKTILKTEILKQIDLGRDNTPLLVLLCEIGDENVNRLESIMKDYAQSVTVSRNRRAEEIKDALSDTRFISGTAVVPDLENDESWIADAKKLKETYQKDLEREKASIKQD